MSAAIEQRNQEATCYVGNLDEKVNEELLWELMLQCGPVVNVHMPKDKVSGKYQGYGFVEFRGEDDAEYCHKVMNMIKLYGKAIKVNKASQDKRQMEVGANIFIGNLDAEVDEKVLHDTFSAFGGILQTPKIMRDTETGLSRGYGFISFESFEASDLAIESMNGQYLYNRIIVCQYAFKKDTPGERHGSQAERLLAASQPQKFKPHTHFSGGTADSVVNMSSATTAAGMQFQQMQQMQQMQLSAYSAMAYGQMQMGQSNMYPPPVGFMNGGVGGMPLPIPMGMMHMPQMPPMGMMPPPPTMGGYAMQMGGMLPPPPPPPSMMMMHHPSSSLPVPVPGPPSGYMMPPPPPPPPV